MGQNNDGIAGVSIENIALEKLIVVGMQAPNTFPVAKIDENGKSLPSMNVSENAGTVVIPSSGYDCTYADNSWLAHAGKYGVSAGNKITLQSGSGGVSIQTSGVIECRGCFFDTRASQSFSVITRLFRVTASRRMEFAGSRLDFIFDSVYFQSNVNFVRNVHVNGGVYINGELVCRHMTTQGQINTTNMSDNIKTYINPNQSFHVFGGASRAANELAPQNWGTLDGAPDTPGFIDAYMAIKFPSPIDELLTLPIKLAFPKGISLLSDGVLELQEQSRTIAVAGSSRPIGGAKESSDSFGPSHQHTFVGPACDYVNDNKALMKKAKDITESETPVKANPINPNGASSMQQFVDQTTKLVQNEAKSWLKKLANQIFGKDDDDE